MPAAGRAERGGAALLPWGGWRQPPRCKLGWEPLVRLGGGACRTKGAFGDPRCRPGAGRTEQG